MRAAIMVQPDQLRDRSQLTANMTTATVSVIATAGSIVAHNDGTGL